MEILVADGMSDDGTRDTLRDCATRSPEIRLIDNPSRIVSTGLNAAIEVCVGEIVIRMDAHTIYASDYVRQCVRTLQQTGADNVGGPWVANGTGAMEQAIAAAFRSPFCCGGGKAHDPNYEGEVDTVYLGCWRRSVFDWAGLFDPALVRNQDDEFNFRLRSKGARIWQSPRIRSWYRPRGSLARLFRQYLQYGFWKVAVIAKHGRPASWRHTVPAAFVTWILLSIILTTVAAVSHAPNLATLIGRSLAIGVCIYMAVCLTTTATLVRSVQMRAVVLVPVVIPIYHVAYGFGFLLGLYKFASKADRPAPPTRAFTAITR
jgi:glycosyltransferase involved in cell wall biosynthesis